MDEKVDLVCLDYVLLLFGVLSIILVGTAVYCEWNYLFRYVIYIATYNWLIYIEHLRRTVPQKTLKKQNKPCSFAFESSLVRALSTANLTFIRSKTPDQCDWRSKNPDCRSQIPHSYSYI